MSPGRYALGALSLILIAGSLALGAVPIRRRFVPDWTGALARLAEAVTAVAMLIAVLELLGTIGWFMLGPIVAASVTVGIGGAWLAAGGRRAHVAITRVARPGSEPGLVIAGAVIAIAATATVLAEWSAPALQSYDVGVRTFDSVWYHLPWAASFAQTGHIAPLRFTDVEYLTAFYPATAEMLHGLGIVLLDHDTLSPALNLIWLGGSLVAAWCIGRSRAAGAASVVGVALLMATPMMNTSQAGSAGNDVVGVFFLLASVAFVLAGDGRDAAIVLAAVAAGLAAGVKLSLLAPVFALTVGVIAIAPRGRRGATAARWLIPLLIAGGYWYARNLIAIGNPLPWTSLGVLPTPAAPRQHHTGFAIAHYLASSGAWNRYFGPGLAADLGRWWLLILGLTVAGPILCLLGRAGRTVRMLGLVALVSLGAYLITPESAAGPAGHPAGFAFNLRYAAPPLALSLAILPLAPALGGPRRQTAATVVLVGALAATLIRGSLWPDRHLLGVLALAAALLGLGAALVALRARARSRVLVVCAGAVLVIAGAAAGYGWQRHYLRGRYQFNPGVSYLSHVWAFFRGVRGARVGVVGTFGGFFSYPLWGPDDSNRVQYIGARGPHGSFTAITSCPRWRQAVNHARLNYVVTTPGRDPWHPRRLSRSPEDGWTGSDRNAQLVLSRRARGERIAVYRIRGRLNPRGCGRRSGQTS
jgi:hypothetical protein